LKALRDGPTVAGVGGGPGGGIAATWGAGGGAVAT
jgi:hypothetical protein